MQVLFRQMAVSKQVEPLTDVLRFDCCVHEFCLLRTHEHESVLLLNLIEFEKGYGKG